MYTDSHNDEIFGDLIYSTEKNLLQTNSKKCEYFHFYSKKIFKNNEKVFIKNVNIFSTNNLNITNYSELKNINFFDHNFDLTFEFVKEYKDYFYNPIELILNDIIFKPEENKIYSTLIYSMPYVEKIHNLLHPEFVQIENKLDELTFFDKLNLFSKMIDFCQNCIAFTKKQYYFFEIDRENMNNNMVFGYKDLHWGNVFYENGQIKFIDLESLCFVSHEKMLVEMSILINSR